MKTTLTLILAAIIQNAHWICLMTAIFCLGVSVGQSRYNKTLDILYSCEESNKEMSDRWFSPSEEKPGERPWVTDYPKNWKCVLRGENWSCWRYGPPK